MTGRLKTGEEDGPAVFQKDNDPGHDLLVIRIWIKRVFYGHFRLKAESAEQANRTRTNLCRQA